MDTILNYLENMFTNLPQTEAVIRAKQELASMMEDKYNELLSEGKTDNEAVGIVISEFGNLKELASELGLDEMYQEHVSEDADTYVGDGEVRAYLEQSKTSSKWIGFGTLLCIFSPIMLLVLGGMEDQGYKISDTLLVALGLGFLFVLVAVAVGFFIYHGILLEKYEYLKKEKISISSASKAYLKSYKEQTEKSYLTHLIVGVIMCIVSVIPLLIVGTMYGDNDFYCSLMVVLLLIMIGIAVYLFITSGIERGAIQILLQEGDYTPEKKERIKGADKIGGIYWPIVTCIYLAWSFITMDWGYTWIIWPVAGVLFAAVMGIYHTMKEK